MIKKLHIDRQLINYVFLAGLVSSSHAMDWEKENHENKSRNVINRLSIQDGNNVLRDLSSKNLFSNKTVINYENKIIKKKETQILN